MKEGNDLAAKSRSFDLQWISEQFPELTKVARLSQGGQKIVLAAEHPDEGSVVLKLVDPGQSLEETQREIEAARSLQNVRVPSVHATGVLRTPLGESVWLREQRIQGTCLRECMPLSPKEVLRLGRDLLHSLMAAEQASIVHRDIKPDNIIQDLNKSYWLLDFGIARHLEKESLTPTIAVFGKCTPGYAPPEQFRNLKYEIDSRSDLFALGITLYEAATGQNPFRLNARDPLEMCLRIERSDLPSLNLDLESATEFAEFLSTIAQRRRTLRPATIEEAYKWIIEICNTEGV